MEFKSKALCLFLAFAMCFSVLSVIPASAVSIKKQDTLYFDTDLNHYVAGGQPARDIFGAVSQGKMANKTIIVERDAATGDNCIMMQPAIRSVYDASDGMQVQWTPNSTGLTGKLIIQFQIRLENWGQGATKFFFMPYTADHATSAHIMAVMPSGNVYLNGVDTGISLLTDNPANKFQTISLACDLDRKTIDLYIDYIKRASGTFSEKFINFQLFNFGVGTIGVNSMSTVYLDNMKVYDGTVPLKPAEFDTHEWATGADAASGGNTLPVATAAKLARNKTFFFPGAYSCVVNGKKTELKDNQKAYKEGETLMVPLSLAAKGVTGKTNPVSGNTQTATIMDHEAVFTDASNIVKVDGKDVEMAAAAVLRDGEFMVPMPIIAELSDKFLYTEEFGLNILSNSEIYWDWSIDLPSINGLIDYICYENPTGAELMAATAARWDKGEHPRLYVTNERLDEIREEVKTSEIKQKWYEDTRKTMEGLLAFPLQDYSKVNGQAGTHLRDKVAPMAFWYALTGDERFAERCWEHIQVHNQDPVWQNGGSRNALGWGRGSYGYAITVDLIWNWMNEGQRSNCVQALYNQGIQTGQSVVERSHGLTTTDNWGTIYGPASLAMGLCIFDEFEEGSKERANIEKFMTNGFRFNEICSALNAPDGAYWEGTGYYRAQLQQFPFILVILENACGDFYGLLDTPGHAESYYWPWTFIGYKSWGYNHGAANFMPWYVWSYTYYMADVLQNETLKTGVYRCMLEFNEKGDWEDLLFCVGDPDPDGEFAVPLDNWIRQEEIVSTRDRYNTYSSFFGAIHGGVMRQQQTHFDAGNFIIQSYGDLFFYDHPTVDYGLPGFGHGMYSYRAEGHNTLLINPPKPGQPVETGDQELYQLATISRFESNEVSMVTQVDLTSTYGIRAKDVQRGMKMTNGRSMIIIQDEVKLDPGSEVYWSAHTPLGHKGEVSEDGKTAIITAPNGNAIECKIISEQGKFEYVQALPLPTSPQQPAEIAFQKDYYKLQIHEKGISEFNVAVAISPLAFKSKDGIKYPEHQPLAEWTLDDPETTPIAEIPYLDDIKVNGKTLNYFDPMRASYQEGMTSRNMPIPKIEAVGKDGAEVTITMPETIPGFVTIDVSNEFYTNTYRIEYTQALPSLADEGYTELAYEVHAGGEESESTNPLTYVCDNNFDTRWSTNIGATSWITLDLGEQKTVDTLSMSLYGGAIRKLHFKVEYSVDNVEWKEIPGTFIASGETIEFENYDLGAIDARYIRISGTGIMRNGEEEMATNDLWFSPQEIKFFKKP